MPAAASRPSRIAQTTNDAPRTMSPAANTPGMVVVRLRQLTRTVLALVIDRAGAGIADQVLLADICDVGIVVALGQQVIKRLIPVRANIFGNGIVPFLAIGENRIDIEDHTAKIEQAMAHDIANGEACASAARCLD